MKKYILIIVCLAFSLTAFTQSAYIKNLGTKYEKVHVFLKSKKEVEVRTAANSQIVAVTDKYNLSYHFREGKLYKFVIHERLETPDLLKQARNYKDFKNSKHPKFVKNEFQKSNFGAGTRECQDCNH